MTFFDRQSPDSPLPAAPDWEFVARVVSGDSTEEEQATFAKWMAAHPQDSRLVEALDRAMTRPVVTSAAGTDVERALRAVKERARPTTVVDLTARRIAAARTPSFWKSPGLRAAALLIVAAGGMGLYTTVRRGGNPGVASTTAVAGPVTYRTAIAQRDSVRLSDGSEVVLGPGSRLVVSNGYGDAERAVQLDGEAIFRVIHDDARPFSVRAGNAVVRDIGTVFTVNAGARRTRVSVREGSVLLEGARGEGRGAEGEGRGIILHMNDVGLLGERGQPVAERGTGSADDAAFATGRLVFREALLTEVADGLRRWYGLELRVEDARLASRRVSATFSDDPASRVMTVLGLVLGARVERQGDTVFVR